MDTRIHMFKSTMHQLYEFIFQNYKKRLGGDATWGLYWNQEKAQGDVESSRFPSFFLLTVELESVFFPKQLGEF